MIDGLGDCEIRVCPRRQLVADAGTLRACHQAIRAWRHWSKGNLLAVHPEPSEALASLILWVDEEVADYRRVLDKRAIEEATRKA
jgi:hypothetical protein